MIGIRTTTKDANLTVVAYLMGGIDLEVITLRAIHVEEYEEMDSSQ